MTTRAQGLAVAAAIIARHVPNLPGLCLLLDTAGCGRLAKALRARVGDRTPEVGGSPHPDPAVWAEAASRPMGGGR